MVLIALTFLGVVATDATAATKDVLRLDDFPAGWRTEPVAPSDRVAPATAACAALAEQQRKSLLTVGTPKFVDPRAASELDVVAATVTTMPSARAAKEQVGALLSRRLLRCLQDAANHRFETEHPGAEAITIVRRTRIPHTDARVHALEARTTIGDRDGFAFTQQIVFVRDGRHIATLHVETDDDTDYSKLRNRLVPIIERRLREGGAVRA
jgi:hypothetical protein